MTNVILCGGSGTRLYPLSTNENPKQFMKLYNEKSFFQMTVKRNSLLCDKLIIVSNSSYKETIVNQLDEIGVSEYTLMLETVSKNTGPALLLSCNVISKDELVLVTPADHVIRDDHIYADTILRGVKSVSLGYISLFGIRPRYPEVNFGYIKKDGDCNITFHEKPDIETAKTYIEDDIYYWNTGIYMFKKEVFLKEASGLLGMMYDDIVNTSLVKVSSNIFKYTYKSDVPSISIDKLVIEKSKKLSMITSTFTWSDIGSFPALYNHLQENLTINSNSVKKVWGSYAVLGSNIGYKIKSLIVNPWKSLSLQKHLYRAEYWIIISGTASVIKGRYIYELNVDESITIDVNELHKLSNRTSDPLIVMEIQLGAYTEEDDIIRIDNV